MVLVEYGELEDREEEVDVAPPLAADVLQAEAPSQYVARADRAEALHSDKPLFEPPERFDAHLFKLPATGTSSGSWHSV